MTTRAKLWTKDFIIITLTAFLIFLTFYLLMTTMTLYAIEQFNASETTAGLAASVFFIVYAVFLLGSRPLTGKLLDRRGENIIIYPTLILFTIGLFCLSQSYGSAMLLIASALIALGFGNMISCSQVAVVNLAPHHRIGLATSTFYIAMDAGIGVGPIFIGSILPSVGYRGMYEIMAVLVVITIVMYYFLHGRKVKRVA
ncbi:MFS transporter [Kurthia senegalensis]|uniref:MFS transporter n=1 Tax=Kurthia senegalensis TaxID=1033740 RepID=UPI000288791F|nr:MFS transporter [Kurthia senegalensis]